MTKKLTMLSMAVAGLVAAAGSGANAALVTMSLSDINQPILGLAGVANSQVVGLNGVDTFIVNNNGVVTTYANAHLVISPNNWFITSASVNDSNNNNIADPGESITGIIGNGTFTIVNAGGVLVTGAFQGAGLSSSINSAAATIDTSNISGLTLVPGPQLVANGITGLFNPESLGLNIDGIVPGVTFTPDAVQILPPGSGIITGTVNNFGVGQAVPPGGSIVLRAELVPEPASLGLLGTAALGLVARRRRA